MPVYSFQHKESGEQYSLTMSYDDLMVYLEEHPEVHQVFQMNLVDPVGIGITKPPADFMKNVIGKVKAAAPGANKSVLEKRWQIPKEI